jgi:hypothetical protein
MSRRSLETSLYAAVKAHLERLGYEAKGEVCGCDIVAVRPGEAPFLVITELKMDFTLDLLLQGSTGWPRRTRSGLRSGRPGADGIGTAGSTGSAACWASAYSPSIPPAMPSR